ncbi:MAG TPA: primosomal protein N', partial [Firmicutes bacterium]|nr:primosomal protein N' [Bacillota bacterium]
MNRYAEILIDMISNAVDRPFHYRIPPEMLNNVIPGVKVTVPFGRRRCLGYVLRVLDHTSVENLRDITAVNDPEPLLTAEQLALVHWLTMHCYCRKIDALHALLPASLRRGGNPLKIEMLELTAQARETDLNRAPAQQKAVRLLEEKGPLHRRELARLGISAAVIRSLEEKNLLRKSLVLSVPQRKTSEINSTVPRVLGEAQAECFNHICRAIEEPFPQRILLHGITASGKTEIYLQSIARCLELGKKALILVPEISLTPQMIEHFAGRFPGRIAVLHSRLRGAEKNRQWQMILSGEALVVLGARSAVFAPLTDIGLIVIDEEHETTYKQEEAPRYHARDVAWWRARRHRAVLLLGSATPSLESYYQASTGQSLLLSMKERVTPTQLPPVAVVDMRNELKEGHRHIFSRLLLS